MILMLPSINLSVNPSYLCNFRCSFCYLTPEQLADDAHASIASIEKRLQEVSQKYIIKQVDIYGGEIALLPEKYLSELLSKISAPVNFVTNLSKVIDIFYDTKYSLSVSYDFKCRQSSDLVLNNMLMIPRDIHVLILASPQLLNESVEKMVRTLNMLQMVKSVEIKPYSRNQANDHKVFKDQYEAFILEWLKYEKRFEFINLSLIQDALDGTRNAYSSDHLYITPSGKYAVLEFDSEEREYFLELESLDDYQKWVSAEKIKVARSFCNSCKYVGRCLTEHYRTVTKEEECDGGLGILTAMENRF
jgi:organic radical activating enzyme